MRVLLVNPPNCGRSIPEERYGMRSLKQFFRGEPLALEVLAGNLAGHEVEILDLKADPGGLPAALARLRPQIVGLTAVTCEANTALRLAGEIKESCGAITVVGGVHASNDPDFFNRPGVDYVAAGLAKASFAELVAAVDRGRDTAGVPGIARTAPGAPLPRITRVFSPSDLVEDAPPRYDLVAAYRDHYVISKLNIKQGFVASAFGCPFSCAFCSVDALTGGRYLTQSIGAVLRDIGLLGDLPVIRLVDANTFGDIRHARRLAEAILEAGIRKHFIVDARADTIVRHPDLIRLWKDAGLRSVIIGFEEIADGDLRSMNKSSTVSAGDEAIALLHEIGVTIVGDFIVSPEYDEARFDALGAYLADRRVDLPMLSVLTPLPGTPLHADMQDRLVVRDLDYYTLTNAVLPTRLDERRFYERYAGLVTAAHAGARV